MTTALHQEVDFDASPTRLYQILMDSSQHAEFTGQPAQIGTREGDTFSAHGGALCGRNIELEAPGRIVQAWRVTDWDTGVYSIIRLELRAHSGGTRLILDHAGFPAGAGEHLEGGWYKMYWEPLKAYLASP